MIIIRRGEAADLPGVSAIQAASPEASQWNPRDFLDYDFLVAVDGSRVAGFLVARRLAEDECELLNLAVNPGERRTGLGRRLIEALLSHFHGSIFLEVRESNIGAQKFYKYLGFQIVSRREQYYQKPPEAAIVLKFHSC